MGIVRWLTSNPASVASSLETETSFKNLAEWIGQHLRVENAVLDDKIACVDEFGRSVFEDLLFRRAECLYFAFDLLFLNGQDLRGLPLIERKARLRKMLRRKKSRILYVHHIETQGRAFLFDRVCRLDLEGIVAKRKQSLYRSTDKPSLDWVKIKNPRYSRAEGRQELFEPRTRVQETATRRTGRWSRTIGPQK